MEPLSAVSLTATVVQLLDFGIKLVAKANEIYDSSEGAEVRNIELDAIAQNLVSLNRRAINRSRKLCAYSISEDEKALEAMTGQCNQVGQELIDALQKAKVQGGHKRWKSVRQALKSVLGRDKIQDIYDRLKRYREQIVVLLLVIISTNQTVLDESVQGVKQKVAEAEARIIDESQQSRFQILHAIQQSNYSPNKQQDVVFVLDLLSNMNTRTTNMKNKATVLDSLYFPRMQGRREWISEAHVKTFSWVLEDKTQDFTPWSDLKQWLRQEEGIYWLNGKAGSGKSTLMKYIDQDQRTAKYIEGWASPLPVVVASFYFWNSGTSMQKSQLGLLQCLLHEVLSQRPNLIPKVVPMRWQSHNDYGNAAFTWTISELSNAFEMLAMTELETKFFFVIDGLDEFEGDHQTLIRLLFSMTRTSNIKILTSSRPWLVFQDAFESSPKLLLQDLTHEDIQVYAHESLYNHSRFDRLLSLEPDRAPKLVTEIVEKSSGVFLWVYLVVRSLMEGLTNADRINDLQRRLKELPADLEQFFLHILTSLDAFYLHQASQLFRLALEAQKPLSVLTFSYLDEHDPKFALKREIKSISDEEAAARCEIIERRLNSRCKGLLESRRRQSCDEYSNSEGMVGERTSYEVEFLHRSVRDFLNTPTIRIKLVALDTPEFNANMTLTRAFVAQLKGLQISADTESNFQSFWNLVFDALYHISRVGNDVAPEMQVALLDELDRAAAHFRNVAIVTRRCDSTVHWVNTGHRFGLSAEWNNNFLTLCIQYGLVSHVRQKLFAGVPLGRSGRPLLAFAFLKPPCNTSTKYKDIAENLYNAPQVEMVKFLLDRGADPNEMDQYQSIWACYLVSLYTMATNSESEFPKQTKDWFEITKLLLSHGASHQTSCLAKDRPGKLAKRVNLGTDETSKWKPIYYSAIDLIRLVFGGHSEYYVSELEDLLEQQQQPELPQCQNPIPPSYLQVPDEQGPERGISIRPRPVSTSSQITQASRTSWYRQTEQDDTFLISSSHVQTKEEAAAAATSPIVQNGPLLTSPKHHKKSWSAKNLFAKTKEKIR